MHILKCRDRDAALSDFAKRARMIRIVSHERGHVEGNRKTGLTVVLVEQMCDRDALDVPVLSPLLGRRRGWLLLTQLALMAAVLLMAFCRPELSLAVFAMAALLVATACRVPASSAISASKRVRKSPDGPGCPLVMAWAR